MVGILTGQRQREMLDYVSFLTTLPPCGGQQVILRRLC